VELACTPERVRAIQKADPAYDLHTCLVGTIFGDHNEYLTIDYTRTQGQRVDAWSNEDVTGSALVFSAKY